MNIKKTHVTKPLLHRDKDGDPRKHSWHYRSVMGMPNYFTGSTIPDLAFATINVLDSVKTIKLCMNY